VTAAAHRHGKPVGIALAEAGYDVVLTDEALLTGRADALRELGVQAVALRLRLYDELELDALLDRIAELGPLRVVVHLAPGQIPVDAIDEVIDRRGLRPDLRTVDEVLARG
jgi:NAD(P)-dependent dehydrogenase (short-subunit alcohol dehydrogenase family)